MDKTEVLRQACLDLTQEMKVLNNRIAATSPWVNEIVVALGPGLTEEQLDSLREAELRCVYRVINGVDETL